MEHLYFLSRSKTIANGFKTLDSRRENYAGKPSLPTLANRCINTQAHLSEINVGFQWLWVKGNTYCFTWATSKHRKERPIRPASFKIQRACLWCILSQTRQISWLYSWLEVRNELWWCHPREGEGASLSSPCWHTLCRLSIPLVAFQAHSEPWICIFNQFRDLCVWTGCTKLERNLWWTLN